ncbi:hypothetical protein [Streptomyces sp. NPDC058572]|uniref:hypothetical protein n=1 Tax=Streptomyces sp. NPDC058572 TaxID=3346546 RepID=UPI0036470A3C
MSRVPSWLRKLLLVALPLVLIVTGAVLFFDADDSGGHSVANQAQLKQPVRGCCRTRSYEASCPTKLRVK